MSTSEQEPVDIIAPEPAPNNKSGQLREPTKYSIPVGVLEEYEGMEESQAYTLASEGELYLASLNDYKVEEAQLQVSCISYDPNQHSSPISSTKASQSSGPNSVCSFSYSAPPLVYSTLLRGSASSLLASSSALANASPGSTLGLWDYQCIFVCQPVSSTLAPPLLCSTWDCHPLASPIPLAPLWSVITLPTPQTSRPSAIPPPLGVHLGPTNSTSVLRHPVFTSAAHHLCLGL